MRLLLAEDEKELSNALVAIFQHNGYSVDAVYDGESAFDYIDCGNYDGIILDIMMPGLSGIEVLTKIRRQNISTPVLLLTAKSEIEDRITGLDAGADDYLPKPFATDELLARVRAMLRRQDAFVPDTVSFESLTLNRKNFELIGNGQVFTLANKEFQMIEMFFRNPGQYISTEQFMESIWGYEAQAEINVVWVCISSLRKKISAIDPNVIIKAKRGVGYMLECKN